MDKELKDKTIICKDCGKEFVHSVRDQEFYLKMKFQNEPTRCKECRISHKNNRNNFKKDGE